jgi:hypothetical protein
MEALLWLAGIALLMILSVYLAVRYGYRDSSEKIMTLNDHLDRCKPGWKIWM